MSHGSVVIPSMRYQDAQAAMVWLERVLGFERHVVFEKPDGTVEHAELRFGTGMIMLGSQTNPSPYRELLATPQSVGGKTTSPVYLVVPDCEPAWARASEAGADVLQALRSMDYGGKSFTLRDPEGYIWSVGEYDPWQTQEVK